MGIYGGLLFLAFNVLVLLVIRWYIANEQKKTDRVSEWLLATSDAPVTKTRQIWRPPHQRN